MIVHHLRAWWSRTEVRLTSAWNALRRPHRGAVSERPPLAMVGAGQSYRSGLASSHWLDDARRLRGHLPAPPAHAPFPPTPPSMWRRPPPPHDQERLRRILRDPRWARFDANPVAWPPRAPQSADPHPAQPAGEGLASRPLSSSNPANSSSPTDGLTERDRRRLVFLRELVRRSAYNEGFAPGQLPEQYQPKRRGPDESPM